MNASAGCTRRIAVIPGDGIGPEVVAAARPVLEGALAADGVSWTWEELPWGSDHYVRHGMLMPPDGLDQLAAYDAAFFGAVGDPRVPDHVTVWGLILPIRQHFDLFVNVRPVRWLEGVPARLAGRTPADVDMLFIRENTEGEYSGLGHRDGDVVEQVSRFTRQGIDRAARFAFEQARERQGRLVSVTKSNALQHSMVFWDEVVAGVAGDFPDVEWRSMHVDAAAYEMVMDPGLFDVVLASNLFGDILTDLGAALQGSLGLAASANLAFDRAVPSLFEPVHGSAPPLAGRGIANPGGAIWAGALMLEHLGEPGAARRVMAALEAALRSGRRTADLVGTCSTAEFRDAVLESLDQIGGDRAAVR